MAYRDEPGLAYYLTILAIWAVMGAGWILNIMSLWHSMDNPVTAKMIVRIAGIFVFPLGAILGYL